MLYLLCISVHINSSWFDDSLESKFLIAVHIFGMFPFTRFAKSRVLPIVLYEYAIGNSIGTLQSDLIDCGNGNDLFGASCIRLSDELIDWADSV